MEKALVDNANSINLETIKTNQIRGSIETLVHRQHGVLNIGWSCALGIFWLFIGAPMATSRSPRWLVSKCKDHCPEWLSWGTFPR